MTEPGAARLQGAKGGEARDRAESGEVARLYYCTLNIPPEYSGEE